MKSYLEKNDMEMYSTCNERKSVIGERFIGTWKNKIYKYMNSINCVNYWWIMLNISIRHMAW